MISDSISIHSLRMEGDSGISTLVKQRLIISIHSLRMEGDPVLRSVPRSTYNFNPLPPYGGRQAERCFPRLILTFQSTPSVWRETLFCLHLCTSQMYFNPLPPYGGRPQCPRIPNHDWKFQSTPSVWRETHRSFYRAATDIYFNPLPPYGGRQQNCTGKRFSFRLSLYNPAKKDAKDYILHPKK